MSNNKSPITTHILDTTTGLPATGVLVKLFKKVDNSWEPVAEGSTDNDGRITNFLAADTALTIGHYKAFFDTESYFQSHQREYFYPYVEIVFLHRGDRSHYHIPLLISPYGYSTYRGS